MMLLRVLLGLLLSSSQAGAQSKKYQSVSAPENCVDTVPAKDLTLNRLRNYYLNVS